ncbi:HIT family protein [Candidatus Saccharibacteria bacterium]|nr:HIT family protein [Candidatus Saccharibacteria bacterium]
MAETIYEKIVSGEIPSFKIWEDDDYIAFLTPFPNTPGHTVVTKKVNPGDYIFTIDDDSFMGLLKAAREVAHKLEKAFDTDRVGMVFHGLGVPHAHAQLIPFHANLDQDDDKAEKFRKDNPQFAHELTASDGPKMDDEELAAIQKRIQKA